MAHYPFQSILSQQWRSQGSVLSPEKGSVLPPEKGSVLPPEKGSILSPEKGSVLSPEKGKFCALSAGPVATGVLDVWLQLTA